MGARNFLNSQFNQKLQNDKVYREKEQMRIYVENETKKIIDEITHYIKTNKNRDANTQEATAWLTQFFGGQKPTSPPTGTNPVQIQQWLQKEVAGYMANQETPAEPPVELPDITKLNREELLQLRQQLQAA
jgi:hypothetical protein